MELAPTRPAMTAHFGAYLFVLATTAAPPPAAIGPGDIRCPGCALTGQKPAPVAFDESRIEFVANPIPSFTEGRTFRINVLARVLNASPLVLEILDSRHQLLDRNLEVVAEDPDNGRDPATCGGPEQISAVDLASKPVVSTLALNDIVAGAIMMRRDERMPHAVLAGTPILTSVRKLSARTRFFHATPIPAHCINRSGRLIVHDGPEDGESTIIYNDGAIYHRNAANVTFTRERLSAVELSDLLRAFRIANFTTIPTTFPESQSGSRTSITLIGARYQRVVVETADPRLAPVLKRLNAIAARATSRAKYVLKRGSAVPLDVRPWPYPAIDLERFADPDLRLADTTPDVWRQRVPDDFLKSLPAESSPADRSGVGDGNRAVYFSQSGKLYRVARPSACTARSCSFRDLNAARVAEPAATDPFLAISSGRLWPRTMNTRLRDVPEDGLTITRQEYDKHKAIYLPLLKQRTLGVSYIDDGVLYGQVRICQLEAGADDTCDVRPSWPSARK
jgi:hypothetical protein